MAKILLVEDDNNLREIYAARLETEGYTIFSANDGEQALAIAVREQPDLIISDVMMPKISGFDMLDILRSTPETRNVKVIVMTALSQEEDRERGRQLGADRYVVKSQVTLEDIVGMVKDILDTISSEAGTDQSPSPTATATSPQQATTTSTDPQPAPVPSVATAENTSPTMSTVDINSADESQLVKEVENFVASSPLMNGIPPQQQAPIAPVTPEQQLD